MLGVVRGPLHPQRQGTARVEVLHLEPQPLDVELQGDPHRRAGVDDGVGDELAGRQDRLVGEVLGAPVLQGPPDEPTGLGDGLPLRGERALSVHDSGRHPLSTMPPTPDMVTD